MVTKTKSSDVTILVYRLLESRKNQRGHSDTVGGATYRVCQQHVSTFC